MPSAQNASYMPLSPVLIAGMLARPLPLGLLKPLLQRAMDRISHNHPDLFDRLKGVGSPSFLIIPSDLPFAFLMQTNAQAPSLHALKKNELPPQQTVDATIQGPLEQLLMLLEGRIDGDALFFSRTLTVHGDTEAVVALRNAVDSADIHVQDELLGLFGPFKRPVGLFARAAEQLFARASCDLQTLNQAAIAPLQRKCDAQAAAITELEDTVTSLKKQLRRKSART